MSKSEQGDEMKMPADNPIEEAREFGEYSPFEDDEEETGEMEDMAMKPKKKKNTPCFLLNLIVQRLKLKKSLAIKIWDVG